MSKKLDPISVMVFETDPTECPFREFRDNELSPDLWGLGPAACRATIAQAKSALKPPADFVWIDDQTQPLPRSVRQYLHGWVRAEELAMNRWEAEAIIFEENNGGKMSVIDIQLSHAQVLQRSSFCRRVLSICYMLERLEGFVVEHQWENFIFNIPPEGWRARYHIYSPGMKPGGGAQHRPGLSKNGCYLVRLFYLGAWRCVWVSDQVPVDATDSPLLPFSPLLSHAPPTASKTGGKQGPPATVTSHMVHLWPLLICKALLKLAAPDMNSDENVECVEDELMLEFDVVHALTGAVNLIYNEKDPEMLWELITSEVPLFAWDEDDDTLTSTVKSRSTKKPTAKETTVSKRLAMTCLLIGDTRNEPPYTLPGITPAHEMILMVKMARDLPLKKPLPEPEVPMWKLHRWVDWARRHGLYEAYECPRTRFLKINGLMKLSCAPHLLDVQSTESITFGFREEHDKGTTVKKTTAAKDKDNDQGQAVTAQMKEELREWVLFDAAQALIKNVSILYYPSMFQFTSAASSPPNRITKGPPNRALDIQAPKSSPLYLQIDGPDENKLCIALSTLNPRVLFNCGVPILEYVEPTYLILERFEWFKNSDIAWPKAFVETMCYDTVEIRFPPGRHFCRIWVHSRMNWHVMLLSESALLLGPRGMIQSAAVRECPWTARFLSNLGLAFTNWIKINRSNTAIAVAADREFYSSYQPDLPWDEKMIGYNKSFLHWMFRRALQSLLIKKLPSTDFRAACIVLRRYFCDPDFGLPDKPPPPKTLREVIATDICDCQIPEPEEFDTIEEELEEMRMEEEKPPVPRHIMDQLLRQPEDPYTSRVCELATEELPCGILKDEREKVIVKHEAATCIQAHWRGLWARKCLTTHVTFAPEVLKCVMDYAFGTYESLSALMNEFFEMYPGVKYAYSIGFGLSGVYGLQQHTGVVLVTPKCKWVPYFQGVFFCHAPVKVNIDVESSLQYHSVSIYNNDTGEQLPVSYNAYYTFDFEPNAFGYTVMGHGNLSRTPGVHFDVHWQLTVLTCIDNAFHVCDNSIDFCKEYPLPAANKLHVDEIFLPNRRNILGGIQISVTRYEFVSFRAAATSPELEMVATLRSVSVEGETEVIDTCSGKGEIHWPYIRLEPVPPPNATEGKRTSTSQSNMGAVPGKQVKPSGGPKIKSATKLKDQKGAPLEAKVYFIEVTAPKGWPLTLAQWVRVDEVRNSHELKLEPAVKKPVKDKPGSAKEKDKGPAPLAVTVHQPQPGDAYVELECSVAVGGGAVARRDDERDLEFAAARRDWDLNEPGRNLRGAQIRKDFRVEFLEAPPPPPSESEKTIAEEIYMEGMEGEDDKKYNQQLQQGPTPATESAMLEMSEESEEEAKYLSMPEQLKDKFVPLYFVPLCTKDIEERSVVITPDIAEAAKKERHMHIEAALERMRELQIYNEMAVLGRQKCRGLLLEKLFVDASWNPELTAVLEERDEAIALEALNRTLSATKKKQETKVKK